MIETIPKPTLHSLAQKFRARARKAKLSAKEYHERNQWIYEARADARAKAFDECASEIEKLKQEK